MNNLEDAKGSIDRIIYDIYGGDKEMSEISKKDSRLIINLNLILGKCLNEIYN